MIRSEITYDDLFNSSGDSRRSPWYGELVEFRNALEQKLISGQRVRLEVLPGGVQEEVCEFIDWWSTNRWIEGVRYDFEYHMHERLPGMLHLLPYGGDTHKLLGLCVSAWLIDQGYTPVRERFRWDISTICETWWIEVGDASPNKLFGALVNSHMLLTDRVCILPFQSDTDGMRGWFDPRKIDMFVFNKTEAALNYEPPCLIYGITDDLLVQEIA